MFFLYKVKIFDESSLNSEIFSDAAGSFIHHFHLSFGLLTFVNNALLSSGTALVRGTRSDVDIMCRSIDGKHSVGSNERWWVEIDMQTSKDFTELFLATDQHSECFNTSFPCSLSHGRSLIPLWWGFHIPPILLFSNHRKF